MIRLRYLLLSLGLSLALAPLGCGEPGEPVAPMGASDDLSNLPEGERIAEEQFKKTTEEAEAKNAAKAAKAAGKH